MTGAAGAVSDQDDPVLALAQEEGNRPEYFDPADLLDRLERQCHRIYGDGGGDLDPEWMAGELDVIFCIMIPELRRSLHAAGLNVPLYGPNSPEWLAEQCQKDQADAKDLRETALYRWWDEADVLLYIGIADRIGNRTKNHAKGSTWMEFAVRSSVERFPRRSTALAAEEAAIKAEKPIFNDQHNRTPEARRRQIDYLIAHGRYDLLAPVVSRG